MLGIESGWVFFGGLFWGGGGRWFGMEEDYKGRGIGFGFFDVMW